MDSSIYAQSQTQVFVTAGTLFPSCEESKICYSPYSIRVDIGDPVTWSSDDSAAHTVNSGYPVIPMIKNYLITCNVNYKPD